MLVNHNNNQSILLKEMKRKEKRSAVTRPDVKCYLEVTCHFHLRFPDEKSHNISSLSTVTANLRHVWHARVFPFFHIFFLCHFLCVNFEDNQSQSGNLEHYFPPKFTLQADVNERSSDDVRKKMRKKIKKVGSRRGMLFTFSFMSRRQYTYI